MKCNQCENNAIGAVGPSSVPLCLKCYALMQQTIERNVQMLREEMNHSMDNIESSFGIPMGVRYPTKRPVIVAGSTVNHNHIAVNNSQIGILNTGNINNLNQTIDSLYSASQKDLAENIKKFSEAIIVDAKLDNTQKIEVLESLDTITKELFQKPESRKKSVVKALMTQISGITGFAADALAVWQVLHPMLQKFF